MNILISGHHVEITPAIRAYVEDKLERVTRHFDQIVDVAVILEVERPSEKDRRQKAEVNLRVKGDVLHAESYAENAYAAIDFVVEKLDRQVTKFKGKIKDHRAEGAKRMPEPPAAAADEEE